MKRILVLGCGSIGERHIRCITKVGGAEASPPAPLRSGEGGTASASPAAPLRSGEGRIEIVACDPREERLAAMRELYDVADTLNSYDEADLSDVDAVMVCTPTDQHIPQAVRGAEANCHIFVEKPISTTLDGVDDLISLCGERSLVLQVGYVLRHHPNLKEVKELLDAGTIGPVHMAQIKVGYFIGKYRPEYAKLYWAHAATGGGVVFDASHQLDFIQWFLGPVTQVCAMVDHYMLDIDEDVEDSAVLLFRFASGAMATASLSDCQQNYKSALELNGEKGSVEWSYADNEVSVYTEEDQSWRRHSIELERDDFYINQARNFLAAINGEEAPVVTGEDGKRALMVALAAHESASTGRVVVLG